MEKRDRTEEFLSKINPNVWVEIIIFIILLVCGFSSDYFRIWFIDHFIEIINIIIWPLTLFVVLIFFRKIFTYMFFSLDEFNFFGLKGSLNNVYETVEKKAEEKYQKRIEEEKRQSDYDDMKRNIENIKKSKEEVGTKYNDILNLAVKQTDEINNLNKKLTTLEKEKETSVTKAAADARAGMADFIFKNYDVKEKPKTQTGSPKV